MEVVSEPVSLEESPGSSADESPMKRDNSLDIEGQTQSRKRPFRDVTTEFTKAVIICNSSELTRSDTSTYRPNNIVIELLKKNHTRYGKFTFQKFTSEKEIRDELSTRFTILKNKKFWFASADQYGKLNFRELEEWSGRNLRRWLPGSSAMYIILENSEPRSDSDLAKDNSPFSGISCTTVRAGTSTTGPVSWHANNSQRALLDFLSSSEKSKLCNTQKLKMFAMNAGPQEPKPSQNLSSKLPARLDLRSLALHTKNQRIEVDLESRISRKEDRFLNRDSSNFETTFLAKRRSFQNSQSDPSFATLTQNNKPFVGDKNLELKHQILGMRKEKELSDVSHSSHENKNTISRTFDKNCQEKNATFSSEEPFIAKESNFGPRGNSNESLESKDEMKDSGPTSPRERAQRIPNYPDVSRIPRFFQPYYLMPDPSAVFGCRPPSQEQKEMEEKVPSGNGNSSGSSPTVSHRPAIYVPSTGFFPWGQINQGNAAHLPDKEPTSLAFVPFKFLPYSASGRTFPYALPSTNLGRDGEESRRETTDLNKIDQRTIKETNTREETEEKQIPEEKTKDLLIAWSDVAMETSPFEPNDTEKTKDKDLVQKFLDILGMEEKMKEGKDIKYDCEMFPTSGPCQGGQSFVVVLNHPLEEPLDQAKFCAKFNDTAFVQLTLVDHSTLKGALPESSESGHVMVRIEADGHLIGRTSFMYEDGFIDGLRKVMFSGRQHGEMMLRFMTASENERHAMQAELTDWLELVVYLSAQNGSKSTIDKIISSRYGDAVKAQCSTRPIQPRELAFRNRRAELSGHPRSNRNDIKNKEPNKVKEEVSHIQSAANNDFDQEIVLSSSSTSDSNDSAHAQDCDESCDKDLGDGNRTHAPPDLEDKADNLMLLSSIASRMGADAPPSHNESSLNSSLSRRISNGSMSAATNTSNEYDFTNNGQESGCPRSGFHKKVFVLPANSLYLPSQSELCKLRGSRRSYCKVLFNAEMNEHDVYEQIRLSFDDLVGFSFRLAVVDQTGKLVFYDGFWTGKVIRRKLRGNSVLYVVPVVENGEGRTD